MDIGTISVKLEGVNFEQTERCRRIIHTLFEVGFFGVRDGNSQVTFDVLGEISKIEFHKVSFRRDKPTPLLRDFLEHATVEVTNPVAIQK